MTSCKDNQYKGQLKLQPRHSATMAAYGAAIASTQASSSQHHANPAINDPDQQSNTPPEPRALRDWTWRKDPEAANNPCHKGDGRGGTGYVNLRKGDLIWTGRCSGTPPRPRSDDIPWRFGLNLQTARSGWFPCAFATKPAKQFLFPIKSTSSTCCENQAPTTIGATEINEPCDAEPG